MSPLPNLKSLGEKAMAKFKMWYEIDINHARLSQESRKRVRDALKEHGLLNRKFRTWDAAADAQADFQMQTGFLLTTTEICEACDCF